jgi:hypothetical protein
MTRRFYPFKAWGFEFQLPVVAVYALAVVVVVGVASYVYQRVYGDTERVLISLKDVNARLAFEIEEFGQHAMEEPTKHELFEDADGALMLRVYADHCVMIQRRLRNGTVLTKLVPDLSRPMRASTQIAPPTEPWGVVHAQDGCSRGCINPHPGPFKWWYGSQRGEWVEVWRRWDESCQHVQMFHPRAGMWESNQDGTPKVRWTCCIH